MTAIYRLIYSRHVNWFLRNLLKRIPNLKRKYKIPPAGILNINVDGKRLRLSTNQTCYVTHLLFWEGYKRFEYSELFTRLILKVNTFYDVGANIGYYSLLGSTINPNLKTYAFEPALGPNYYLSKNIALNGNESCIKAFNIALSNQKGEIKFHEVKNSKYSYLDYNLSGENNLVNKAADKDFVERQVQAQTLDNVISTLGLIKPELLKIDTEGAEPLVLEGSKSTIIQARPVVLCEILSQDKASWITDYFKSMENYVFFKLIKSQPQEIKQITEDDLNETHDFLFVPKEKMNLID